MTDRSMELLKGTLDVLILKTVSWGPLHGYAISRTIRSATAEVFRVEEGALYPALRRLEKKGLLKSEWATTETGRDARFYELTREGKAALRRDVRDWGRYVEAMGRVLYATAPAAA